MRKNILVSIQFMACLCSLCAQSGGSYQAQYQCRFNVLFDRGSDDKYFQALLSHTGEHSHFYMRPMPGDRGEEDATSLSIILDTLFRVTKYWERNYMVFGEAGFDGMEHFYRDSLHPQIWVLLEEKKTIADLQCFKAETFFRGRKYIAWFTPDIPLPDGPWKLGGLPGLILEAYDEGMNLHFTLQHFTPQPPAPVAQPFLSGNPDSLPDYPAYVFHWRQLKERMDAALRARETGNCVGCATSTQSRMFFWELLPE